MNANADLSVLIVSFNTRDLLRDGLRSLLEECRDAARASLRVEVLVLDNASRDGSADMVAAEFPGVRLVRRDNGKELASVAQWGPYAGQLHRVHQVTFDNRGNLYTAEIERALGWT